MAVPSVTQIKQAVAEEYGVTVLELASARRSRSVAHPRQAAMWLCRRLTGRSLPEIGRMFGGRDHTTVTHACKAVERRLADPDERERLTRLADLLSEGDGPWPVEQALADWVLQEVDELQRDFERLQDRLARFALVLASATGKRPMIEFPPPPEPSVEPEPAPPAATPPAPEAEPPSWQCRTPSCGGTRQPGRDLCAACITGKSRAA